MLRLQYFSKSCGICKFKEQCVNDVLYNEDGITKPGRSVTGAKDVSRAVDCNFKVSCKTTGSQLAQNIDTQTGDMSEVTKALLDSMQAGTADSISASKKYFFYPKIRILNDANDRDNPLHMQ